MYNQKRPVKQCVCGRGEVYTGDSRKFNAKVDGKDVCPECALDNIYERLGHGKKDS